MGRIVELVLFCALAVIVHVVGFSSVPATGVEAGGVGGENAVSIIAASSQVETMIDIWDRPPAVENVTNKPITSSRPELSPALSIPNSALAIVNIPSMQTPDVTAPEAPIALDTSSAKPPLKPVMKPPPEPKKPLKKQAPKPDKRVEEKPKETKEAATEKQPEPEEVVVRKPTKDEIRPPFRQPMKLPTPKKQVQKARINQKSSAGSDGQLSKGKGKSAFAGTGNAKVSTGVSTKQLASIKAVWGARIRRRIERMKKYPRGVHKNGRAVVIMVVSRSGNLMNYRVGRSSGNSKLDAAALQAVNKSGRLPPAPKELTGASYKFIVPIVFKR